MTHSGGKPHGVGDQGQQYEVSYFDENLNRRAVLGWTDSLEVAKKMAAAADLHPSWKLGQVRDRRAPAGETGVKP